MSFLTLYCFLHFSQVLDFTCMLPIPSATTLNSELIINVKIKKKKRFAERNHPLFVLKLRKQVPVLDVFLVSLDAKKWARA